MLLIVAIKIQRGSGEVILLSKATGGKKMLLSNLTNKNGMLLTDSKKVWQSFPMKSTHFEKNRNRPQKVLEASDRLLWEGGNYFDQMTCQKSKRNIFVCIFIYYMLIWF